MSVLRCGVAVVALLSAGCSAPMPELWGVTMQPGAGERFAVEVWLRDADDDREVVHLLVDPANFGSSPGDQVEFTVGAPRDDDGDGAPSVAVAYGTRVAWSVEVPADIDGRIEVLPARRIHVRGEEGDPARGWVLVREVVHVIGGAGRSLSEAVELKPADAEKWLKGEEVALPPREEPR